MPSTTTIQKCQLKFPHHIMLLGPQSYQNQAFVCVYSGSSGMRTHDGTRAKSDFRAKEN